MLRLIRLHVLSFDVTSPPSNKPNLMKMESRGAIATGCVVALGTCGLDRPGVSRYFVLGFTMPIELFPPGKQLILFKCGQILSPCLRDVVSEFK